MQKARFISNFIFSHRKTDIWITNYKSANFWRKYLCFDKKGFLVQQIMIIFDNQRNRISPHRKNDILILFEILSKDSFEMTNSKIFDYGIDHYFDEKRKWSFLTLRKLNSLIIEKLMLFTSSKYLQMRKLYFESFFLFVTSNWIVPKGSFPSLNTVSSLNINYICNILNCTFSYYILMYYILNINNVLILSDFEEPAKIRVNQRCKSISK